MDVRTRRTGARLRVDFAAARVVVAFFLAVAVLLLRPVAATLPVFVVRFAVLRLADAVLVGRVVERTDPFVFFRDAAAFNCFPLFGVLIPALEQDAQDFPDPPYSVKHSSRGAYGRSNSFY